eukprot:403369890
MEQISALKERLLKTDTLIVKYKEMQAELSLTKQERDNYKTQLTQLQLSYQNQEQSYDTELSSYQSQIEELTLQNTKYSRQIIQAQEMQTKYDSLELECREYHDQNLKMQRELTKLREQLDAKKLQVQFLGKQVIAQELKQNQNIKLESFGSASNQEREVKIYCDECGHLNNRHPIEIIQSSDQGSQIQSIDNSFQSMKPTKIQAKIENEFQHVSMIDKLKVEKELDTEQQETYIKNETIEIFQRKRALKSDLKDSKRHQKQVRFSDDYIVLDSNSNQKDIDQQEVYQIGGNILMKNQEAIDLNEKDLNKSV